MKLPNLLFLVMPAMAFQNYTMLDMPISVSPLLKVLPKYDLPSEHMTWDQLTNAQEERNKEHGCRYEINDHIITLKPTSKMSTTEHAAWAQSVHDKSTKEGLDPTCKGVQTKLSIRDIEWYYHGCFALDALHEIALHQDVSKPDFSPLHPNLGDLMATDLEYHSWNLPL
jgi:hypothetical protein